MTATDIATDYAQRRAEDWERFASGSGALVDYWAAWQERSFNWKIPIVFLQPLGADYPERFDPLRPLLAELAELEEVDVPPVEWLHTTYVEVGFLRAVDVLWSQVESFYANAAPRVHRVEPFSLRLRGISIADDGRIYLGVEDGGQYREVRRQVRLGVPQVYEKMKTNPDITPDGDRFMPVVDIGFFTGRGSRARVMQVLESHRDLDLGEVALDKIKMARLPIFPHDHYYEIDVVAEIAMYGKDYRTGYHN